MAPLALLAGRREPVGEEEDVRGPPRAASVRAEQAERFGERAVDVRAAAGAEAVDVVERVASRFRCVALQLGLERLHAVVVGDDVEQVVGAEVVEHEGERVLRLLHLAPGHRARAVDYEDDGFGERLRRDLADLGAGEEEEVAVLRAARPVAEERRTDGAVTRGLVDQAEIAFEPHVVGLEADACPARARARSPRRVTGCTRRRPRPRA